jgi:fibronectin-binding autotransporter adhesin
VNENITDAGGMIAFDQSFTGTFSGVISDGRELGTGPMQSGSLDKDDSSGANSGNVIITQVQTFSGDTYIEAGSLTLDAVNALADSNAVILGRVGGGATASLVLGADNQLNSLSDNTSNTTSVLLNGHVLTLTPASGSDSTFGGVIADGSSSGGGLVVDGSGTVTLSGANTFTGGVMLGAGTLELGNSGAAGSGTITFAADVDPTLKIDFGDLPTNTIVGFAAGDVIDLAGIGFSSNGSATISGGTLTVVEGGSSYALQLSGSEVFGHGFQVTSDGSGGANVTLASQLTLAATVSGGETAADVVVGSGGTLNVLSGGSAIDFTVSGGGLLTISSGGYADPGTLSAGTEYISAGGTDNGTLISGGTQVDYGSATGDFIFAGS